jgi:hypothetical protein
MVTADIDRLLGEFDDLTAQGLSDSEEEEDIRRIQAPEAPHASDALVTAATPWATNNPTSTVLMCRTVLGIGMRYQWHEGNKEYSEDEEFCMTIHQEAWEAPIRAKSQERLLSVITEWSQAAQKARDTVWAEYYTELAKKITRHRFERIPEFDVTYDADGNIITPAQFDNRQCYTT